jgi:hypothetical protein
MKAMVNRRKNFLYTHEERNQLIGVVLHTNGATWRGKIPLVSAETLKGVGVGVYRPTKKIYSDPKQFPGKEMPQREFKLDRYSYLPA